MGRPVAAGAGSGRGCGWDGRSLRGRVPIKGVGGTAGRCGESGSGRCATRSAIAVRLLNSDSARRNPAAALPAKRDPIGRPTHTLDRNPLPVVPARRILRGVRTFHGAIRWRTVCGQDGRSRAPMDGISACPPPDSTVKGPTSEPPWMGSRRVRRRVKRRRFRCGSPPVISPPPPVNSKPFNAKSLEHACPTSTKWFWPIQAVSIPR